MICCDTCPYYITCEELEPVDWGEEYGDDYDTLQWADDDDY